MSNTYYAALALLTSLLLVMITVPGCQSGGDKISQLLRANERVNRLYADEDWSAIYGMLYDRHRSQADASTRDTAYFFGLIRNAFGPAEIESVRLLSYILDDDSSATTTNFVTISLRIEPDIDTVLQVESFNYWRYSGGKWYLKDWDDRKVEPQPIRDPSHIPGQYQQYSPLWREIYRVQDSIDGYRPADTAQVRDSISL